MRNVSLHRLKFLEYLFPKLFSPMHQDKWMCTRFLSNSLATYLFWNRVFFWPFTAANSWH